MGKFKEFGIILKTMQEMNYDYEQNEPSTKTLSVLVIDLLLFIPANIIYYWNGWLFMGILFVPMFIAGIILMVKNPELLRKRLNAKEK